MVQEPESCTTRVWHGTASLNLNSPIRMMKMHCHTPKLFISSFERVVEQFRSLLTFLVFCLSNFIKSYKNIILRKCRTLRGGDKSSSSHLNIESRGALNSYILVIIVYSHYKVFNSSIRLYFLHLFISVKCIRSSP